MSGTVFESPGVRLTLFPPPPDLQPYVTTFYRTEAIGPGAVEDWLPPESANLRMGMGRIYEAGIGTAELSPVPPAIVSGPTSRATRLRIGDGAFWGIGLLPVGFAAFVGAPANAFADRYVAASDAILPPALQGMMAELARSPDAGTDGFALMVATLRGLVTQPIENEEAIVAAQAAIVEDVSQSVAVLADRLAMSVRTLQRFGPRYFGFAPQMLLRRQRFLRSLAKFMLDPSMKWIGAIDTCYHDQSHFLRDFRRFMLMRPTDYAQMPHPIAVTAARARSAVLGEPMQVLHIPATIGSDRTCGPASDRAQD